MSWTDKAKEWGGGDLAFLSEDGECLDFIVLAEPVLLAGKYKGRPTEKIGCPVMTDDGFVLFVVGKRLFRKIAKHESQFGTVVFQAVRHGEQGDIHASYELRVLDNVDLATRLFAMKEKEFQPDMVIDAVKAAEDVMSQ